MTWSLIAADCVEVMAGMEPSSIDAVVTDPPYGLEFMGKEWDRLDGGKAEPRTHAAFRQGNGAGRDFPTDRESVRPSFKQIRGERCDNCGKMRGGKTAQGSRCSCSEPIFRVVGRGQEQEAWHRRWVEEAFRVLKPGGHLLSFGGTRTYHRLVCALEDAGFEIRDCLAWLYGSGFPKSLDVSKAIDKAAGAEREVVEGPVVYGDGHIQRNSTPRNQSGRYQLSMRDGVDPGRTRTLPAAADAERWQGWGTALKPAFEPIVLARKPLSGTVAENVLRHGVGALNVDGTRIEGQPHAGGEHAVTIYGSDGKYEPGPNVEGNGLGRWPANVLLDADAAAMLDEQSGDHPVPGEYVQRTRATGNIYGGGGGLNALGWIEGKTTPHYGDSGGASRFFKTVTPDRENDLCDPADTAASSSSPLGPPADTAPSGAATSASPEATPGASSPEPSTSDTASGSRPNAASGTPPIPSTGAESSPVSPPSVSDADPASGAEQLGLIDTTTTTTSRSRSAGSAGPATSSTTPPSVVPGVPVSPSDLRRAWYTAKTSRSERENGVAQYGEVPLTTPRQGMGGEMPIDDQGRERDRFSVTARNNHPTVKPVDLMQWLCRLITPPHGLILDPFTGSGSTGIAALREGFSFIGIEREPDYVEIARARIIGDAPLFNVSAEI